MDGKNHSYSLIPGVEYASPRNFLTSQSILPTQAIQYPEHGRTNSIKKFYPVEPATIRFPYARRDKPLRPEHPQSTEPPDRYRQPFFPRQWPPGYIFFLKFRVSAMIGDVIT
jgi:hypothetical protein